MSDSSEKQFDATPTRVAKARREGNVPRSQELAANVAFIAAAISIAAIAPEFAALARRGIVSAAQGATTGADELAIFVCALVVASAAAVASLTGGLLQTGGLTIVPPSFRFSRIAPADGLKRMLSGESATHAVRAIVAFFVAGAAVGASMHPVFALAGRSFAPAVIAATAWTAAEHAVFAAAATGLLFAFFEYGVARRTWLAKLKMSLHDLKRELKENDGDPEARARRKTLHRSLIRGALSKVKDASFVVVNPTHVAVALEYRPPEVPVPVVLVRAADEMALRVRNAAAKAGIPIIENVPLARALFTQAQVGESIPRDYYVAVAEIVSALIRNGAFE